MTADQDITVTGTTERQESLKESRIVSEGFLSKKVTEKRDQEILNAIKSSTLSGETVEMKAGKDLTIQGSNVVGTKDVNLSATNQIHLDSQEETGKTDHYSFTKKSGLFGGSGLGFTIGSKSEKTTTKEQTVGAVGSTIGSEKGNIFITAGEKVNSAGTTFISGNDLTITGKAVTIDNTKNTYDSQTKYEFKQSGLSVSLGGGAVATATKAVGNLERSRQVQDDRLQALYDYKAFQDLKELNKELGNGINKESLDVSVNVSLGSSKMTSEETVHTETVNTSNINAGGNVVIKGTEKDVTLNGTKINAKDITLDAAKDITLGSGENKQETDSKTSSSSWSVGGSLGANPGYFGNVSKGSGKEHGTITTHTGSTLDASGTLTLKSGEDTNINGSQAKGEKVVADIEGDLNIASQQDTDDYTAKNKNSGIGFGTGKTGGVTGSVGKGKTDSTYNSITEQAGIIAGKDGFAIHVGKNTDLKGAVISSDATPDKNKLSTDTLTYSDIQNKAEYSASSTGFGIDTKDRIPVTPTPGMPVSGDAGSTTKSAVATGTIEVRSNPNQDLSGLSRDPSGALNALDKIFDKKTVQEKQELAKVFGEVAFNAIGDLALSQYKKAKDKRDEAKSAEEKAYYQKQMNQWDEGGSNKILLHALAGGIMSDLGGNGFASGVVSAGVNEAIQKQLSNIKDPGLHQLASALVGGVAAKIVGGNASVGASVAASATKNNFLTHEQYAKYQAQLEDLKEKLKDGSITQEEYNVAVNEVTNYWADKDKKQNKQWLADNHIEAVSIEGDFGQGVTLITLKKQQYQQMLIELNNSKNEEETASIKEKWRNASKEQIDQWVEMGKELGYNMDGSKTSLFPDLSREVVNINNPYTAWLIKTETENSLFWAERSLQARGIDPNDPGNAQLLAAEVEKQLGLNKEIQESIASSIGGGSFKTFKELKAFLGSPGAGNQWHHIVEQAQQNASRAGFAAEEINTVENIISLQSGKESVHSAISAYYSSKFKWTEGLTVRDWLASQSFEEQFKFGMNYLKNFGNVVKENGRWIFKPFE